MTTKTRVEILKLDLEAAFSGSHWHSFKSAVKGLSEDEARWVPPQYKGFPWMDGSLLRIIFHLGGDSQYQLSHALGKNKLSWEVLETRFQGAGGTLEAALQICDEGHLELQAALDSLSDEKLLSTYPTPEGKGERSLLDFFRMKIEHHHYHAGQIVYIRSMWKAQSEQS